MRNKKGDLGLSIQAIVVIILAITLLGLGLTFVRQFFGKGAEGLGTVFDAAELETPASLQPLTLPKSTIVQSGDQLQLDIGFYCKKPSGDCANAKPILKELVCTGKYETIAGNSLDVNPASGANGITLQAPSETVKSHAGIGFKGILKVTPGTPGGTFVCTLDIIDAAAPTTIYETGQLFIQIE